MSTLHTLYEDILRLGDCTVVDGVINYTGSDGRTKPIKVNSLPWVMPTKDNISNMVHVVGNDVVVKSTLFNPLDESSITLQTPTDKKLSSLFGIKINLCLYSIISAITNELSTSGNKKYKSVIPGLTSKMYDKHTNSTCAPALVEELGELPATYFIRIHPKRRGRIDGTVYSRVSTVSFPFTNTHIDDLVTAGKLREKDKLLLDCIVDWVFPEKDVRAMWMFGSNDPDFPAMISQVTALSNIWERLTAACELIGHDIPEVDFTFTSLFENPQLLKGQLLAIPAPPVPPTETTTTPPAATMQPAVTSDGRVHHPIPTNYNNGGQTATAPQSVPQNPPPVSSPGGKVSAAEILGHSSSPAPPPQQQPMMGQVQGMPVNYQQPQPMVNTMGYQQPIVNTMGYQQPMTDPMGYTMQPAVDPMGYAMQPAVDPMGYNMQQPGLGIQGFNHGGNNMMGYNQFATNVNPTAIKPPPGSSRFS